MGWKRFHFLTVVSFVFWFASALQLCAQVPDIPSLTVYLSNQVAFISWPVASQNFALQRNKSLVSSNWAPVLSDLQFNPATARVETYVLLPAENVFFRLVRAPVVTTNSPSNFKNLNFELGVIVPASGINIDAGQAFPYWNINAHQNATVYVLHDNLTIGSPAIDLMDATTNYGYTPLERNYSVLLQYFGGDGNFNPPFLPPSISQNGLIPATAKSINFWVGLYGWYGPSTNAIVRVNGVSIPLTLTATNQLAGNIAPWAGQVAEVLFTLPGTPFQWLYFDRVTFPTNSVP